MGHAGISTTVLLEAQPACGGEFEEAGRVHHHRGLRCDPGRWRHAHGGDYRRLRGAVQWMRFATDIAARKEDHQLDAIPSAGQCDLLGAMGIYKGVPVIEVLILSDLDYPEDSKDIGTMSGPVPTAERGDDRNHSPSCLSIDRTQGTISQRFRFKKRARSTGRD